MADSAGAICAAGRARTGSNALFARLFCAFVRHPSSPYFRVRPNRSACASATDNNTLSAITAVGKGLDAYVAVDACGTFSQTKREAGLLRMLQAGVIVTDYASLMVEILKDNSRPDAGAIYGAMDMPWAKLVGQIAQAYGK